MPRRQRFDSGRNLQNLRVIPTLNKSLSPNHKVYTLQQNQVAHPAVIQIPKQNPGVPIPKQNQGVSIPKQNQGVSIPKQNQGVPIPKQNQGVPIPKQNRGVTSGSLAGPRQNQSLPSTSTVNPGQNQFKQHQQGLPPPVPAVNNKPNRTFRKRRNRKNRHRKMQELPYQSWYDPYNVKQVVDPVIGNFEKVANVPKANVVNVPKAKAANVPKAKVENVPKAKVENVTKAKVENVTKAKVENVSKAKLENAPKAKVENVPKAKNEPKAKVENEAEVGNVSEAEIEKAFEAKVENLSEDRVENVPEGNEENYFEEVEVASVEGDGKQEVLVGYRKTKRWYLSYKKKKCFFRPKIFHLGERTFVNCLNMQDDIDVDVVSEAEYEYENDNLDKNELQDEKFVEVNESEEEANKIKVETKSVKNDQVRKTVLREYKTCIESSNELTQRECLIQSSLDTWKSHLLGLEYLIEIQNEDKDVILKYNCILCNNDVSFKGLPAIHIMNHVNSCSHVVRYLEKHFSGYGFKFAENNSYHVDALKKIAEEINNKLGYYFMCVTTSANYTKSEQDFKKIIESAYHPNEKDVKLDETLVKKALNFNLEEIQNILSDIISKVESVEMEEICSPDVVATAVDNSQSDSKNNNISLKDADSIKDHNKKKKKKFNAPKSFLIGRGKFSKPFSKGKAKSAFSSYLKSKYAKAAMHKKSLKGFSSHFNKESFKNENSKTNDGDDSFQVVADSTEQSVKTDFEMDAVEIKEAPQMSVEDTVTADIVSNETDVNSTECNSGQHAHKNREKVPLKATTVHSKHCRKTISDQVISAAIFMQCVY